MFGIQWDMTRLPPLPGANILIDAAGNAKLADFGACMQLEARQLDGHEIKMIRRRYACYAVMGRYMT